MKIVVVSQPGYPSHAKPFRAIFVHELCRKLQARGLNLAAVTANGGARKARYQNILIYRIGHPFFYQLTKITSIEKPNIMHVHFADSAMSGVLAGRLFQRKTIIHCHRDDVDPDKKLRIRILRNLAFKLCHRVIAVSKSTSLLAQQCGASPSKITIIYNSANEELYVNQLSKSEARRRLRLPLDVPIFLAIGNLIERKGFNFLIDGASRIQQPTKVIIVGEGKEKAHLGEMIASHKSRAQVTLWGSAPEEDMVNLYKAADVFVLPSLHEGHSMVLLEAMVSGLPIIATKVPGNTETIQDRVNGILVPAKDPVALQTAMTTLINDAKMRERLGENGLKVYFEKFSEDVQLTSMLKTYFSLVGLKAS